MLLVLAGRERQGQLSRLRSEGGPVVKEVPQQNPGRDQNHDDHDVMMPDAKHGHPPLLGLDAHRLSIADRPTAQDGRCRQRRARQTEGAEKVADQAGLIRIRERRE